MKQKTIYLGLPVIAVLFCLFYIRAATCDIVYTDYIRLVNTYLPDVWNPAKFLVPDILTRIPVYYLARGINTTFFGFSTAFDMVLGALSLGLSGLVIGHYCAKRQIPLLWYLLLIIVFFNLNKWEMLTNGSGWAHFLAFAGFYYHYLVFDRVLAGRAKKYDQLKLLGLPFIITLAVAGPYCAVYSVNMLLFYTFALLRNRYNGQAAGTSARDWLLAQACVLAPLLLYLWSNSYAVEDHADAYNITFGAVLADAPGFFPRFLLKAMASAVIGGESLSDWLRDGVVTNRQVYLLGMIVAAGYLLAFVFILVFRLYEESMLPCMLLVSGLGNHGIVLISRYIFLNENYGMSSRYALQYQSGIIGIILIFALVWKRLKPAKVLAAAFLAVLMAGQLYTNQAEWNKAHNRKEYAQNIVNAALNFEALDDDKLRETFDYRKSRPDSGAKVRQALTILKENNWNVFR